jgi:hypothetical protein
MVSKRRFMIVSSNRGRMQEGEEEAVTREDGNFKFCRKNGVPSRCWRLGEGRLGCWRLRFLECGIQHPFGFI